MVQSKKLLDLREENKRLKAQNARLRRAASDNLGADFWGLKTNHKFTHEEIVFLFARIFQVLGFESILSIKTTYPDCTALENGQKKLIEFEPYLSNFRDHITKKHDLSKCDFIICWKDDLEKHSYIKKQILDNKIEIIELKTIWQKIKVKKPKVPFCWSREDFAAPRYGKNKLKVLSAFIIAGKKLLTKQEIGKIIEKKGTGLGGSLKGFSEENKKGKRDFVVKYTPKGWKLNERYRNIVKEVLSDFEMI